MQILIHVGVILFTAGKGTDSCREDFFMGTYWNENDEEGEIRSHRIVYPYLADMPKQNADGGKEGRQERNRDEGKVRRAERNRDEEKARRAEQ